MSIGTLGKQEFSPEQAAKASANVPKETMGLPDINVSVQALFLHRYWLESRIARTAQSRRAQKPKEAPAIVGIGLWQDIYRSYAHDWVVEGDGMGCAVDQGVWVVLSGYDRSGWSVSDGPLSLDPASSVFHYAFCLCVFLFLFSTFTNLPA
jgi:hypothetical protein